MDSKKIPLELKIDKKINEIDYYLDGIFLCIFYLETEIIYISEDKKIDYETFKNGRIFENIIGKYIKNKIIAESDDVKDNSIKIIPLNLNYYSEDNNKYYFFIDNNFIVSYDISINEVHNKVRKITFEEYSLGSSFSNVSGKIIKNKIIKIIKNLMENYENKNNEIKQKDLFEKIINEKINNYVYDEKIKKILSDADIAKSITNFYFDSYEKLLISLKNFNLIKLSIVFENSKVHPKIKDKKTELLLVLNDSNNIVCYYSEIEDKNKLEILIVLS